MGTKMLIRTGCEHGLKAKRAPWGSCEQFESIEVLPFCEVCGAPITIETDFVLTPVQEKPDAVQAKGPSSENGREAAYGSARVGW